MDTTSSAEPDSDTPGIHVLKFVNTLNNVQQTIGLARLYNPLVVSSVLKINKENGYTHTEITDYKKFVNGKSNNVTLIEQIICFILET